MNSVSNILAIFVGGGLGACCRYLSIYALTLWIPSNRLPVGLLSVNLIGSFLIGIGAGWILRLPAPGLWQPLLITGFLGGFTTFSSFSLDNADLLRNGAPGAALLNISLSVIGGLLLASLGFSLTYRSL